MTKFSDFGLNERIMKALDGKYSEPTPIQAQSIPLLMKGHDLLGIAQTGTGKTAAFALPSIDYLSGTYKALRPHNTRMLVLAPTRELASQIAESFQTYGRFLKLSVMTAFGGVPINRQIRALSRGIDVLVATPGRLLDLVDQRALDLSNVEILVLDEADQMLDLGFIHDLRRIVKVLPKKRQSLFFSATMPPAIAELAKQFLTDPRKVSVAPQATTAERVEQQLIFINQSEKQSLLTLMIQDLGDEIDRALVFSRTKHGADRIVRFLKGAGIGAEAIHGNKSQPQRERALGLFRSGDIKILVATDIAARGIDVPGVSHVFNFEIPNVPEQYVHRIGRTARAGREGLAIAFVDSGDERTYMKQIERLIGIKLTQISLPENFMSRANALPKPAPRKPGGDGASRSDHRKAASGGPRHGRGGRNPERGHDHGHERGSEHTGERDGAPRRRFGGNKPKFSAKPSNPGGGGRRRGRI